MLHIQKYFIDGGTIEGLKTKGISAKFGERYPNLCLLKYDQLEADWNDPMTSECRGIILDVGDKYKVVSISYNKFWNAHEARAAKIDWSTAKVFDKADGSLAIIYYYDNAWQVQTSGTVEASGQVGQFNFTFKELFWKTWNMFCF